MRQIFKQASAQPTVTQSSAYSSGNCIGSTLKFSDLAMGGSNALVSASLVDASGASGAAAVDLFLFSSAPTTQTDKSAVAFSAADIAKCIGVLTFASANSKAAGTPTVNTVPQSYIGLVGSADNHIYGQLVTRGTPNFGANSTPITVVLSSDVRME
jgi:hypothetical protein